MLGQLVYIVGAYWRPMAAYLATAIRYLREQIGTGPEQIQIDREQGKPHPMPWDHARLPVCLLLTPWRPTSTLGSLPGTIYSPGHLRAATSMLDRKQLQAASRQLQTAPESSIFEGGYIIYRSKYISCTFQENILNHDV